MNILILGTGIVEQKLINICLKSRLLDHLYTASNEPLENIPNIEYDSWEELAQKAKDAGLEELYTFIDHASRDEARHASMLNGMLDRL